MTLRSSQTIAVIDFETTGLSPNGGGRATEIAAVLVRDGQIVDSYQSLMKTGAWVPPFIQELTGISNEMLVDAPSAASVMQDLASFTRACPLVAHNAAFDRGFWQAEMHWRVAHPIRLTRALPAPFCFRAGFTRKHRTAVWEPWRNFTACRTLGAPTEPWQTR